VGKETDLLDHVPDPPAQLHRVHVGHVVTVEVDPPLAGFDQPVDHPHRRGLARTRGTDQHADLPGVHLEVKMVDGHEAVVVPLRHRFEPDHSARR
jgi:hypothetical protein